MGWCHARRTQNFITSPADFRFCKNSQTRSLSKDLGGTWYEYGIGANFNLTKQTHLYADLEAASGEALTPRAAAAFHSLQTIPQKHAGIS